MDFMDKVRVMGKNNQPPPPPPPCDQCVMSIVPPPRMPIQVVRQGVLEKHTQVAEAAADAADAAAEAAEAAAAERKATGQGTMSSVRELFANTAGTVRRAAGVGDDASSMRRWGPSSSLTEDALEAATTARSPPPLPRRISTQTTPTPAPVVGALSTVGEEAEGYEAGSDSASRRSLLDGRGALSPTRRSGSGGGGGGGGIAGPVAGGGPAAVTDSGAEPDSGAGDASVSER